MEQEFLDCFKDLFNFSTRRLRNAWLVKLQAIQQCDDKLKKKEERDKDIDKSDNDMSSSDNEVNNLIDVDYGIQTYDIGVLDCSSSSADEDSN